MANQHTEEMNKKLLLLLALPLLLAGCRTTDQPKYEGKVETTLTYSDGTPGMTIKDSPDGAAVTLRLKTTKKSDKATTYALELTGIPDAQITPSEITLPAGSVSCDTEVKIVTSGLIFSETTAKIALKGMDKSVSLTVKPRTTLKLTEKEQGLLAAWRRDLGIDLVPFLGEMVCSGTVKEPGEGSPSLRFGEPRTVSIDNQVMTVAISPNATETRPVLDFTENALGLQEYFKQLYLYKTVLDTEAWNFGGEGTPPASQLIMEKLGWTKETPISLNLSLINITVDPENKSNLLFLGSVKEAISKVYRPKLPNPELTKKIYANYPSYREENGEPMDLMNDEAVFNLFHFDLSVWDKLVELSKTSPEINEASYTGNVSPYQIFFVNTIDKDGWEGSADITHYVKPQATIDYENQTMHFVTVMDITDASAYSVIDITCKPKN